MGTAALGLSAGAQARLLFWRACLLQRLPRLALSLASCLREHPLEAPATTQRPSWRAPLHASPAHHSKNHYLAGILDHSPDRPTLRVSVSFEDGAQPTLEQRPLIGSFWHSCLIPATYICRDLGVRVMSSNSYDGEYMGRIIRRFGFVAVKGSSSRNAVRACSACAAPSQRMDRCVHSGWPARSRHKVKPGPVALARSSGVPLTMFHAAVDKAWVLNTWDRLMIPMPFSRVLLRFGKLIPVPAEASDEEVERYTGELQTALDRVCEFAEANVCRVGTSEFPYRRD